jgi:hypothetical protein
MCCFVCLCADSIEAIVMRVRMQLVDQAEQVFQLHNDDFRACTSTMEITSSSSHTEDGGDTDVAAGCVPKRSRAAPATARQTVLPVPKPAAPDVAPAPPTNSKKRRART